MHVILRVVVGLYGLAALVAWLLALSGAIGWFGADGLAGIYAILLALPWSLMLWVVPGSAVVGLAVTGLGMAANVAVLVMLGRWLGRR